jgi:hypothetical protein
MTDGMTEALKLTVFSGGADNERGAKSWHGHIAIESLLTSREPIAHLQEAGVLLTDVAARTKLLALYAAGVRVLPIGARCDGFDPVTGCPGHRSGG